MEGIQRRSLTPPTAPALLAEGLVRQYGQRRGGRSVRALDGFSLQVGAGEIVGLIGHNGAGKTTFAEIVCGLERPDAGRVEICGQDVGRSRGTLRRLLGYAPQELALYGPLDIREHLRLFAALAGLRGRAREAAVERVVGELRLEECLAQRVSLLSGGQRRRVQAACAMVGTPRVLLLDEPTAGADPETRSALLKAVRARAAEGAAVVYTTHYLPELTELDATLAVARRGRVIARGSLAELTHGLRGELRISLASGEERRLRTADPAAELATLLPELLAAGAEPTAIDIRRPGLDDLYRSLDGSSSHAAA